jgi:IstB-like ATP binding protein
VTLTGPVYLGPLPEPPRHSHNPRRGESTENNPGCNCYSRRHRLPLQPLANAANLFFQLVSSRYEHASLILTSNLPFSSWAGVFGEQVVAAAMIDRIVHHADVIALKGASYRLRDRGVDTLPSIKAEQESLD